MPWTVVVKVEDVNQEAIAGATMQTGSWNGRGGVRRDKPAPISANSTFDVPDDVISITIQIRHPKFANLMLNLVRQPGEKTWRWTHQNRTVVTDGTKIRIQATMGRMRGAPLHPLTKAELEKLANQALAHEPKSLGRKGPEKLRGARIESLRGLLTNEKNAFPYAVQWSEKAFRVAAPEVIGDPKKGDWEKFASEAVAVDMAAISDLYFVEYGQPGPERTAPRFLIAMWVPKRAVSSAAKTLDFVLWLHPNTRFPLYPVEDYPFRSDYPYVLLARRGTAGAVFQPFVDLPLAHLGTQHWLSYSLAASGRAPVLVVPVAPSSEKEFHVDPFICPATLIRLLKEICLFVPRMPDDSRSIAQPPRLSVGRVAMAGFSSGAVPLGKMIGGAASASRYGPEWRSPPAEFEKAWREVWSIDAHFESRAHMTNFLESAAGWVNAGPGRRFRFYNRNATNNPWDPREEKAGGAFGQMIKSSKTIERGRFGDQTWALQLVDPGEKFRICAFADEVMKGTGTGKERPPLIEDGHWNMATVMFGHAARTSGFKT